MSAAEQGVSRERVPFTRRELRERLSRGDTQLKVHLARLVSLELVDAHRGAHGQFVYELAWDSDSASEAGGALLPGLIDPDQPVEERQPHGYDSDPLGFPVLVMEFLESMAVRGYSPATIENHRYNLTYLVIWLGERGVSRPGEVTKPMLDRYQRAVFHHRKPDGQPLSFRSQVQRLTPIRALFKWLARQNRILYNPASELELPKAERRLPRAVLSQAEAELVLAVPDLADPGDPTPAGPRQVPHNLRHFERHFVLHLVPPPSRSPTPRISHQNFDVPPRQRYRS